MKINIIIISIIFLMSNVLISQNSNVILKTDFKGEIVFGSIDSLISKLQEGKNLKIGWQLDFDDDGKSDLDHWIDAEFISILNGHVFNQISPIYRQMPKKEIPQVEIIESDMQWTAIIGTNGKLISRYIIPDIDLIEDENVRNQLEQVCQIKERIVATIWVIQ